MANEVVQKNHLCGRSHKDNNTFESKVGKSFFTYSPQETSISYPWPSYLSGLERIALSARGDLQRVLSAFFARPISVSLVFSNTYTTSLSGNLSPFSLPNPKAIETISRDSPIIQTRQVRLMCAGRVVCVATSTVRLTSPEIGHLFLEEGYAIGQMFVQLKRVPCFELLEVGSGPRGDAGFLSQLHGTIDHELWRKYRLSTSGFDCEILEIFPSRRIFFEGESWILGHALYPLIPLKVTVMIIFAILCILFKIWAVT